MPRTRRVTWRSRWGVEPLRRPSETEPTPGGASGMTEADPRQNGTKAGRGARPARVPRPAGTQAGGDAAAGAGRRHQGQPCPRLAAPQPPARHHGHRDAGTERPGGRARTRPGLERPSGRLSAQRGQRGGHHGPSARVAGAASAQASRRRPGGPADLLGQPGGDAQPRAAAVGTRLLHRRPAAAQLPGGLRGPGHARRPAGQAAAGRSQAAGADRAGAEDRADHPAAVPARRACPTCPAGTWPRSTARPARSAATSTTSSRCRTAGSCSWSATSPTRASRPRW